jgi:hypothetical protein
MVKETTGANLEASIGRHVQLYGIAWEGKPCAILEIKGESNLIYIEGLMSWDDWGSGLAGSRIGVKGVLKRKRLIPEFKVSETGAVNQGAVGDQLVLEGAQIIPDTDAQ